MGEISANEKGGGLSSSIEEKKISVSVVIPVYNEERGIKGVINQLHLYCRALLLLLFLFTG